MTMKTRQLGKTGLEVSAIGMGGTQLGSSTTDYAVTMIRRAFEQGVTYIDTARGYSDSEDKLGLALSDVRDQVVLSTKTGGKTRDDAWRDLETSLAALKTDYVDNWHMHGLRSGEDMDQRMGADGALQALIEAREQGIAHHIGASAHRAQFLVEALDRFPLEVILVPMNIAEREPLEALIPLCRERGVGITIMKPLATGLLPARLALRWLLTQPVDCMVPGITSLEEALANAAVGHETAPISELELAQIAEQETYWAHKRCRICSECLPCPAEINLPIILGTDAVFNHYRTMGAVEFRSFGWQRATLEKDRARRPQIIEAIQACTDCGACEERCPHDLPIRDMLTAKIPLMQDMLAAYDEILD